MPAEMVQPCFGRAVGEIVEMRHTQGIYGTNVYNARRIHGDAIRPYCSCLQQWEHESGECEDVVEVQSKHLGPRRLRIAVDVGPPGGAAVVYDNMELFFPLG